MFALKSVSSNSSTALSLGESTIVTFKCCLSCYFYLPKLSSDACVSISPAFVCTAIVTDVAVTLEESLKSGEVTFALRKLQETLTEILSSEPGAEVKYDWVIPIEIEILVSLECNFTSLTTDERAYFEEVTQAYLLNQLAAKTVNILGVYVLQQNLPKIWRNFKAVAVGWKSLLAYLEDIAHFLMLTLIVRWQTRWTRVVESNSVTNSLVEREKGQKVSLPLRTFKTHTQRKPPHRRNRCHQWMMVAEVIRWDRLLFQLVVWWCYSF